MEYIIRMSQRRKSLNQDIYSLMKLKCHWEFVNHEFNRRRNVELFLRVRFQFFNPFIELPPCSSGTCYAGLVEWSGASWERIRGKFTPISKKHAKLAEIGGESSLIYLKSRSRWLTIVNRGNFYPYFVVFGCNFGNKCKNHS